MPDQKRDLPYCKPICNQPWIPQVYLLGPGGFVQTSTWGDNYADVTEMDPVAATHVIRKGTDHAYNGLVSTSHMKVHQGLVSMWWYNCHDSKKCIRRVGHKKDKGALICFSKFGSLRGPGNPHSSGQSAAGRASGRGLSGAENGGNGEPTFLVCFEGNNIFHWPGFGMIWRDCVVIVWVLFLFRTRKVQVFPLLPFAEMNL